MEGALLVILSAVLTGQLSTETCVVPPIAKTSSASKAIEQCGAAWDAERDCDRKRAGDLAAKPESRLTRLDYRRYMYGCLATASGRPVR